MRQFLNYKKVKMRNPLTQRLIKLGFAAKIKPLMTIIPTMRTSE